MTAGFYRLCRSRRRYSPAAVQQLPAREDSFSLTVRTDGKERHFTARRVVGADGAFSLVRRTFYREPKTRYTAIQQWFPAGENRAPFYSCIFDPGHQRKLFLDHTERRHPDFWRLLFSTGQREAYNRQKSRLEEYLGHSLGRPIKTEACQAVRPRGFSDFITGRDGVYLIGEAAGFISASSFEGISSAIRSGSALAAP